MGFNVIILVLFLTVNATTSLYTMSKISDYEQERNRILSKEKHKLLGGNIKLSEKELKANKILLNAKIQELDAAYANLTQFLPSMHFFESKHLIEQSNVYKILKKLPKWGSLHTHLLAGISLDYLVNNISYRDGLYGRFLPNGNYKLKFFDTPPIAENWTEVKRERQAQSRQVFDKWIAEQFSLLANERNQSVEEIWAKFKRIFTTIYDMLAFRPVFQDFIYQLLKELYEDNVMYTELRGTIMELYEIDGSVHTKREFFDIFIASVARFRNDYPKFHGVRYIHSVYRGVDENVLEKGLDEIIAMKKVFSDFIAGFDFVGFEEEGKTLFDYRKQLEKVQKDLKFFFHAGETNWFGHTDINLIDAVLLNSTRIGHGYAINKHPEVLALARKKDIPMEICPTSNQVLMLLKDQRNHPATNLIAIDYPIVVCNDDPLIWNATGLSYDWYITFMAMTSKTMGLEFLKQLAMNSIKFSGINEVEKNDVFIKWKLEWDEFIDFLLSINKQELNKL